MSRMETNSFRGTAGQGVAAPGGAGRGRARQGEAIFSDEEANK